MLAVALGLVLAVFVADRVLPGLVPAGSQEAAAMPARPPDGLEGRSTDATPTAPQTPPRSSHASTVADMLEELASRHAWDVKDTQDAFRPPESWLRKPAAAAPKGDVDQLHARQFAERYKLSATAVMPDGGVAILNGRCLSVGQTLEGLKLVGVTRNSATFARKGVRVTLSLDGQPAIESAP